MSEDPLNEWKKFRIYGHYNGYELYLKGLMNTSGELADVREFLDGEYRRFFMKNQQLQNPKEHFHNYLLTGLDAMRWRDEELGKRIKASIHSYCEQATEPQQSKLEEEPTTGQIEKLRYLHLSGLLPLLIEQHKRISGQTSANWDSIAHVVSKMIGEPVSSIRKTIREHYTSLNNRLEDFKSKEEVLGFLKSKKVRE